MVSLRYRKQRYFGVHAPCKMWLRWVLSRKISTPCGVVFIHGNLAWANRLPFIASETELTIPAPLRHKKKVRRYENNRKKSKETGIYRPSIQHRVDFEDCRGRSGFLRVGRGVRVGSVRIGFLLAYPAGYRILPCISNLSDRLFLLHFHTHILIS
jgi:hypothetical protein